MPKIIGNPTITPMAVPDWNQTDPTKADYIKNKPDVYTKSEVNAKLDKKVSKEDIVSAYKFCGSVEKFEDLPHRYELIPNIDIQKGLVPTLNGQPLSGDLWEYDEDTGEITLKDVPVDAGYNEGITIPIVPINIVAGKYFTTYVYYGNAVIGDLHTYECGAGGDTYVELKAQTIDHIEVISISGDAVSGTTDHLGYLDKITDSWLPKYSNVPDIPSNAYDNGNVYNVIKGGMNYAWTGTEWDALGGTIGGGEIDSSHINNTNNPHKVTASQVGAYTKSETDKLLANKVSKEDIVSAYKFCGSVEKFEDLPLKWNLIPDSSKPLTYEDGTPLDSNLYSYASDGTLTINEHISESIIIPIKPITVPVGDYYCDEHFSSAPITIGDNWFNTHYFAEELYNSSFVYTDTEKTINKITVYYPKEGSVYDHITLYKALDTWYKETNIPDGSDTEGSIAYIPDGAYNSGNVYNVLKDGMNYAWTGTEWDALGGEHRDIEAREQIEALSTTLEEQTSDIETALDSIIEIQNSLIGGDSV